MQVIADVRIQESVKMQKFILCILILSMIIGCTSKQIKVVTFPPGAEVSNGSEKCESPCKLYISSRTTSIAAELPDGRVKTVEVNKDIANRSNFFGNLNETFGNFSTSASLMLAGFAGMIGFIVIFGQSGSDPDPPSKGESQAALAVLGLGIGSYFLWESGEESDKRKKVNDQIEIDFIYDNGNN